MAIFDVEANGQRFQIEAPDEAAAVAALASLPSAPTEAEDSLSGSAKALGVGLAEGGIGLVGLPADAANLATGWYDKLTGKHSNESVAPFAEKYGYEGLKKIAEGHFGEFRKPQTVTEKYLDSIGRWGPAAIGGPVGAAGRIATRAVIPGVASEAAGQLTEGTEAEPYARIAAGLGGAVAGNRIGTALSKPRTAAQPSAEDLLKTGSAQFEAVKDSGATIAPADAANIARTIKTNLFNDGARPETHGAIFKELDRLEKLGSGAKTTAAELPVRAGTGLPSSRMSAADFRAMQGGAEDAAKPITMGDMESVRKALVGLKTNADGSMRHHAGNAANQLLRMQAEVLPADVSKTLKDAIGNWAAGKRSNTVMGKVALGELNADTAGAGANADNAARQAIKQLVRPVNNDLVPKAARLGFNKPEVALMNKAARGSTVGNTARYIGKLAPTGIVSGGMSGGAGYAIGGPIGAVALPAIGYVAKKIGDMSTQRAIKALDSLVRSRSPLAVQVAQKLPHITQQLSPSTQALLSVAVAAQAARAPVYAPANNGR